MSQNKKYDKALLELIVSRDKILLIGDYDKLTCKSDITFVCPCSKQAIKKLASMYQYTSKCKECTNKIKGEKIGSKLKISGEMDQLTRNNHIIEKLKEKFPTSDYDYSKVNWNGKISSKITMICNKHKYEWDGHVGNLLRLGCGCIKCGFEKSTEKTRKDFIGESKEKFGKDIFDYSKVKYNDAHQDITLTCIKHNEEFTCVAREHLSSVSGGCPSCYKENSSGANHCSAITLEEFKKRIESIWGDKFTYDFTGFTHLNSKIKISCSIHKRTWEGTGNNHTHPTNPRGCVMCGREEIGNKLRMPIEECMNKFRKVHNDTYIYDKVIYKNNGTDVIVTCKVHGDFKISPAAHWNGYGCPMCSQAGVSKAQLEWLKYIEQKTGKDIIYKGGKHNREKTFRFDKTRYYKVDGYCEETKTIYEFLGCWYHGCPECQNPEKIHCWTGKPMKKLLQEFQDRKVLFEKNGYNMEYMWECKWKLQKQ